MFPPVGVGVVEIEGVTQFERLIGAGPTRSSICAVDELPELRLTANAVPNRSQARPPGTPFVAAVRSMPASPNSLVPSVVGVGAMLSAIGLPNVFTAPSAAEIVCCVPQQGGESEPTWQEPLVTHFEIEKVGVPPLVKS